MTTFITAKCGHGTTPHSGPQHEYCNATCQRTAQRLLTPGEVAALFRVDPKTVARWAKAGRISAIRTLGGHRRFREAEVQALLNGEALG